MPEYTDLITSVGFPIFCCIMLGIFIWKLAGKMMDINKEREDKLYTIIGKSQEQLDRMEDVNDGFLKVLESYKKDTEEMKQDIHEIKTKVLKNEE